MIILTIRTDKPEAEIGLYEDDKKLAYEKWQAHRQLAETINRKIQELLSSQGLALEEVSGLVVYRGPGSFTGLRIGLSVANALAYGLNIPIIAAEREDWQQRGIAELETDHNDKLVMPFYDSAAHVTQPKK